MTEQIIDISDRPAALKVRHANLVVEQDGTPETTVPLDELAVLVVSHPSVTFTHAVLSGLGEAGGAFVACDRQHTPVAMMLPLQGHYVQAERFRKQTTVSLPLRKRLWQQVVRAKIHAQAAVLRDLRGDDSGLSALVQRVRSGDPENVEAQAARRYWPAVFADPSFRRSALGEHQNAHLNYGYAVLRALVARAVCAVGLHPSFGIHHHNRYDCFCLADDLMEPFRPVVDRAVALWVEQHGTDAPFDREAKAHLLQALSSRLTLEGESRTLFDVVARTASSLVAVIMGNAKKLVLPEAEK